MRDSLSQAARVLTIALLVTSLTGGASVGTAAADTTAEQCLPAHPQEPDLSAQIEQVDDDTVTIEYNASGYNEQFIAKFRGVGEVLGDEGFVEVANATYQWDGETETPTITYDSSFPSEAEYGYIVQIPNHEDVEVETSVEQGIASRELALVGSKYKTYTTNHGCEEIRLVVPCDVNVKEKPRDVIDMLKYASVDLSVGNRWSTVTVFAVEDSPPLTNGVYFGHGDMVVRANAEVDTAENAWLHEYVHSRQGWNATNETAWLTEASATYHAARLAIEQGRAVESDMEDAVGGYISPNTTLSKPDTWGELDQYQKGSLVLAALDQRLRDNSQYDFEEVFKRLNNVEGNLTQADVNQILLETGGQNTVDWYTEYATTSNTPKYSERLPEMGPTWYEKAVRRVEGVGEWYDRLTSYNGHCADAGWDFLPFVG